MKKIIYYKKILVAISIIVITISVSACTNDKNNNIDKQNDNKDIQNDTSKSYNTKEKAIDFTLSDGKGGQISLSDYEGKLVFLNFFTTWCKYCIEEMPEFKEVYEEYGNEEFEILIVDVFADENKSMEEIINWYENNEYSFPIVFDEFGEVSRSYYINGYPTTYVIDAEGYIIGVIPGAMDKNMLKNLINDYK